MIFEKPLYFEYTEGEQNRQEQHFITNIFLLSFLEYDCSNDFLQLHRKNLGPLSQVIEMS